MACCPMARNWDMKSQTLSMHNDTLLINLGLLFCHLFVKHRYSLALFISRLPIEIYDSRF